MARSRNIKPGFFSNDLLAEVDPLGRLLFAGLWTLADREGRLEDRPKKIKATVLVYDRCDVEKLLTQLCERGFIIRYEVKGQRYIQVVNWSKHQQPHYKEVASEIPPPPNHVDSGYVAFGVSEAKRQQIFDRDGRKCTRCGSSDSLTLDHIKARANGGSDDDDNLTTLCNRCNASKGRRDVDPTSGQRQVNHEPTLGQSHPLIPDSLNLIPDTGFPEPSTPPTPSEGDEEPPDDSDDEPAGFYTADFEQFWSAYPRKKKKGYAFRCWQKVKGRPLLPVLLDAVARQKQSHDWLKDNGDYIPHPSTWLNGRSWDDEVEIPPDPYEAWKNGNAAVAPELLGRRSL